MTDWTPTRKVTAATVGGAIATLVVILLQYWHIYVAPEGASALATLFALGAGYWIKETV